MATRKQREAARRNIRKAQAKWRSMTRRERARAQPEGRRRAKPGTQGTGDYFHVVVRPKEEFITFRTHDVGQPGGIQRVAGKRASGSWDTQKWLIGKEQAHVEGDRLVPDTEDARKLFEEQLGSVPVRVRGDVFKARPRPNVPESEKPTPAQQRAWRENIKKAQQARRRRSARRSGQRAR